MISAYLLSRGLDPDDAIRWARLREEDGMIVFPWFDAEGNEIYKTGRSVNGEKKWRHQKGARPPLYASPGAWESTRVALVEGQLDAIASVQSGTAAFAASGSSLSPEAVKILAGKDEVILATDADDAGEKLRDEQSRS